MTHSMGETARAAAELAVLAALSQVAGNRLAAHGVGPLWPVDNNEPEDGRGRNRRVEMVRR